MINLAKKISQFFPRQCILCQALLIRSEYNFCPDCLKKVESHYALTYTNTVFSVFHYEGVICRLLQMLKCWNPEFITSTLSKLILKQLPTHYRNSKQIILAVPGSPERIRKHLFQPAYTIADCLSSKLKYPFLRGILIRDKTSTPQSMLSASERIKNIKGHIHVQKYTELFFKDQQVLLVDDVMTTGSTFKECFTILKQAGVKDVQGFSLAKASIL